MEEKKFVSMCKEGVGVKEFIKREFGKGIVSNVIIEYTPIGEKVIISTTKPGIVIGKKGESIERITGILKKKYRLENPHIEIDEIKNKYLDAQIVADEIALAIERFGSLRFKAIAYKMLTEIKNAGAIGGEIVLSGRLPSERAKSWRFKFGYLKKTGDQRKFVDNAKSVAQDKQGVVGIKVSILKPDKTPTETIKIDEELIKKIKENAEQEIEEKEEKKLKIRKKKNG